MARSLRTRAGFSLEGVIVRVRDENDVASLRQIRDELSRALLAIRGRIQRLENAQGGIAQGTGFSPDPYQALPVRSCDVSMGSIASHLSQHSRHSSQEEEDPFRSGGSSTWALEEIERARKYG